MASIVLGSIGSNLGQNVFNNAIGASIGHTVGSYAGRLVDQKLFANNQSIDTQGHKIDSIHIQTSTYGKIIPIVYGNVKIAGNIIWASKLKEIRDPHLYTNKKNGGKIKSSHTEYNYKISLAIAICEGPITEISRIWANDAIMDLSSYNIRIYNGDEQQLPDPLIESIEGLGKSPAYRGLAYVLFENLPIKDFQNRIPQFTFEVKKNINTIYSKRVEEMISAVTMIPGSGEFVYDSQIQTKIPGDNIGSKWVQKGHLKFINQHTNLGKSNSLVSLDQLQQTLPNIKWVAPVVNWFTNSLDISKSSIYPCVEYNKEYTTSPDKWKVANLDRSLAQQIKRNKNNKPIYGGTISDNSILRYLAELKRRGHKIMFYPMLLVESEDKPWRGEISGNHEYIKEFFYKREGYNNFIIHYAKLVKGKVDAFIIGSELVKLTNIRDKYNNFPAVDALIDLARQVKNILGKDVKVSYGADWSEYHHAEGGWYNLDPLWSSQYIDFVGIDAYFPLTNSQNSIYDYNKLIKGWEKDEGYDFYYTDSTKKEKRKLATEYAWKNIKWWWENYHVNPDGKTTPWKPKSKKIWFTEYGFPSVDCTTNQPNTFFDPHTSQSNLPIHSKGYIDFFAQRTAIYATEKKWENSEMVENKFLWTWDARPYPFWPHRNDIWSDADCWNAGHWVQGKLGCTTLAQILVDICLKSGFSFSDINVSSIKKDLTGFFIINQLSAKKSIEYLQSAYLFDVVEIDNKIHFISRIEKESKKINHNNFISTKQKNSTAEIITIKRLQDREIPNKVNIHFISYEDNYKISSVYSSRTFSPLNQVLTLELPFVLKNNEALKIAECVLYNLWIERVQYYFALPMKYINLVPSNLITTHYNNSTISIRINKIELHNNHKISISGVKEDNKIYFYNQIKPQNQKFIKKLDVSPTPLTQLEILDIPYFQDDDKENYGRILLAVCGMGKNWRGATIYFSYNYDINKKDFKESIEINKRSTIGTTITKLNSCYSYNLIDYESEVIINLIEGHLESINIDQHLNDNNLAIIGNEIIQFKEATLIEKNKYKIKNLLRGRFGTEKEINNHLAGDRFVLLNHNITSYKIPNQYIKFNICSRAITFGHNIEQYHTDREFKHEGQSLKPLSPVNIRIIHKKSGLLIKWDRRTRINGAWLNNIDIPLNEEKELYTIKIYKDNVLVQEYNTPNNNYFIDFNAIDLKHINEYSGKIFQISALVGEGNQAKFDFNNLNFLRN